MDDTTTLVAIGDGLSLLELALRGRWNVAAARAAHVPQELTQQNEDGLTALHLAVMNAAPPHLFAAMLSFDGDADAARFVQQACLTKDASSGMTPLLCAAASFAPLEVMQRLVDACPEAVKVKDDLGATCLHHVCSRARGGGFSSVRRAAARAEILLQVEPSLARLEDDFGMTPIHVLCREFEQDMQSYWLSKEPDVQLGILRFDVDGLWLFFDTLLGYEENFPGGNILHRVVSLSSPPLPLVSFICRRFPLLPMEQDSSGNTPLHIAVQGQLFDVASFLVKRFSQCASILNSAGESVLALAARSFPACNHCLRMIIMAYPSALENVLDDDILYAQLFANLLRRQSTENGACAVFDILRRRPEMVERGALLE